MTATCKLCGAPVDILTGHLFCRPCDQAVRSEIMQQFRLLATGIRNALSSTDVVVATNNFRCAWNSLATLQKFFDYGAIDDLRGLQSILQERFLNRLEHLDGDYLAENLKLIERQYREKVQRRRDQETEDNKAAFGICACVMIGPLHCPRCGAEIPETE